MRWMRFISVLFVLLPLKLPAQHYSEGACVLLLQQAERYSHQKNHPNYKSARREYDKHCLQPTKRTPVPVKAAPTVAPAVSAAPAAKAVEVVTPAAEVSNDIAVAAEATVSAEVLPQTSAIDEVAAASDVINSAEVPVADNDSVPEALVAAEAQAPLPMAATEKVQQAPLVSAEQSTDLDALFLNVLAATPLVAANIVAFLLVVFLLTNWLGLNLPGFKGVFAEYKLNRLLRWYLTREYQHFRKLRLTNDNNETVVIDHLVLSPYGIFVIMVKGYRGRINGSVSQANWTRDYLGSSKQFMNPLHQNFKNMQALKQLLGLSDFEPMHSVIAFARVGQFAGEMPANITYIDTTSNYIKQHSERCINDEQLARFAALINQACE